MHRSRRSSLIASAIVVAGWGSLAAGSSPAQAVTCSGSGCTGKDPMATGCAADAKTVTSYVNDDFVPTLVMELRWSPTCQTNWGRVNRVGLTSLKAVKRRIYKSGSIATVGTGSYFDTGTVYSWTRMIYSPDAPNICVRIEAILAPAGRQATNCY
jgi:hypothetical protein